jgi:predicted nucleic acid-binding protein
MRLTVVYLDTNILIYACIEQDVNKKERSISLIEDLIESDRLYLSTLTLQEFVFTMAKLRVDTATIKSDYEFFKKFVFDEYDKQILQKAVELCCKLDYCKNINDVIHVEIAQRHCNKLFTFDTDFKKLKMFTNLEIKIL